MPFGGSIITVAQCGFVFDITRLSVINAGDGHGPERYTLVVSDSDGGTNFVKQVVF